MQRVAAAQLRGLGGDAVASVLEGTISQLSLPDYGLHSLIATCKNISVDPFAYLRNVIARVSAHPRRRIEELTPRAWNAQLTATSSVRGSPPRAATRFAWQLGHRTGELLLDGLPTRRLRVTFTPART